MIERFVILDLSIGIVFPLIGQDRVCSESMSFGWTSECIFAVFHQILMCKCIISSFFNYFSEVVFPVVVLDDLGDIVQWLVIDHTT